MLTRILPDTGFTDLDQDFMGSAGSCGLTLGVMQPLTDTQTDGRTSAMEITTLCAVVASLRVVPNKSQFFQYEPIWMSCEHQGNSSGWRVRRNASTNGNVKCLIQEDMTNGSTWVLPDLYPSDAGVYWCQSGAGECSNSISISVTAGSVILESPVVPVPEGEAVTLRCRSRSNSSSADFYKDELLIGSSSSGSLSLLSVSRSDEGVYHCSASGAESPRSRLSVAVGPPLPPPPPPPRPTYLVLPVVGVCLLLLLVLLCRWRSHKENTDQDISYTDVTVTQDVQPHRMRDEAVELGETFYSTLNLTSI